MVTDLIKLIIFISTLEWMPSFELDVLKSWASGASTLLILMLSLTWNPSKKVVRLFTGLVCWVKIKLVKENNTQKKTFSFEYSIGYIGFSMFLMLTKFVQST